MTPAEAEARVREADAALQGGEPTPFPLPVGNLLPIVAGTVAALDRADWWVPGLRERAGAAARDVPVERLVDGLLGARPYRVAPPGASGALRALYAVGLALANPDHHVVVHLGIGSMSDGAAYEALNLAALQQAPVIFVVAVDPLDGDAPLGPQCAAPPARLAASLGIEVTEVDGTSAQAVHGAVRSAKLHPRPHLIEARLAPAAQEKA